MSRYMKEKEKETEFRYIFFEEFHFNFNPKINLILMAARHRYRNVYVISSDPLFIEWHEFTMRMRMRFSKVYPQFTLKRR